MKRKERGVNPLRVEMDLMRDVLIQLQKEDTLKEEIQPHIDNLYGPHEFTATQGFDVEKIRTGFKELTQTLYIHVPESPYRTIALRRLHETSMLCISAIASGGESLR